MCTCGCVCARMGTMGAAAPGRADDQAAVQKMHENHVCIWGARRAPQIPCQGHRDPQAPPPVLPITSAAPRPALQLGFVLDLQRHNGVFFHAVMLTASSFALNW